MKFNTANKIIIAGHRGNPAMFPENTMESFRSAVSLNVDMIETDIHTTKDSKLVLMHDHDVKRTTDGEGLIKDMSFDEIRKLNAGDDNQHMFVPTLRELLELVAPVKNMLLDLELKVYLDDEGEERVAFTIDKTVNICDEFNMDGRIMFNCFDAYVLEYIHKKYGNRFILHGYYPYNIMQNINIDPTEYLDYACYWGNHEVGKDCCDFLVSKDIAPCTGSNTIEEDFFEAVKSGCTMFTENNPSSAIKWRELL